jgi:zeta-carotene desaturase
MDDVRALDGISFSDWFIGKGGSRGSIQRMWDPIAYALVRVYIYYCGCVVTI